jgi:hypothetical protein
MELGVQKIGDESLLGYVLVKLAVDFEKNQSKAIYPQDDLIRRLFG